MSSPAPPPGGEILYQSPLATILWGDNRDPAVINAAPAGYDLLATDPPYGVSYRSRMGKNFQPMAGDDGSVDWPAVLAEWIGPQGTTTRGLAHHRHVYVFGYRPSQLQKPLRLSATAELVWDKTLTGMGNLKLPWGPAHEPITFGVHSKSRADGDKGHGGLAARLRRGSVIRARRPSGTGVRRHPTEKPVPLMAQLIESSTVRGDLVVDPCAGSGSTLVAAVLTGRRAYGVEVSREYAELACARIRVAEKIIAAHDTA